MSYSMEKMCVQGRLGQDAELRYLPNGKGVLSFSVAIDGKDDNQPTTWRKVTVWGDKAEQLANEGALVKGAEAYAEGWPKLREWDGNDGKHHAQIELTAYLVQPIAAFRTKRRSGNGAHPDLLSAANYSGSGEEAGNDDIPF